MTTVLLYHLYGLVEGQSAVYKGEHLLVADGIEAVEVAEGIDSARLLFQSVGDHLNYASVDALVQLFPLPLQAYLNDPPRLLTFDYRLLTFDF